MRVYLNACCVLHLLEGFKLNVFVIVMSTFKLQHRCSRNCLNGIFRSTLTCFLFFILLLHLIQLTFSINVATGMNKSKDPFEIAFEEQEESPPDSPVGLDENEAQTSLGHIRGDFDASDNVHTSQPSTSSAVTVAIGTAGPVGKPKEDDDDEEEENMDVELGKLQSSGDPDKVAKMQTLLAKFTDEQMSRYESFRRSGFQKSNMKRLLTSITGIAKISVPMTIVVSGIGKMFVGELIETARMVMSERKETGPIRPCHIREAYRRLKLEGKIPKRSVPRLFR